MNHKWHLIVSFKTELFSEYLLQRGLRDDLESMLPEVGLLHSTMFIDNDVYEDLNEIDSMEKAYEKDLVPRAKNTYSVIKEQSEKLDKVVEEILVKLLKDEYQSLEEIINDFNKFAKQYQRAVCLIVIPTVIDLLLEKRVKSYIVKSGSSNPDIDFQEMAISTKIIDTIKEKSDLLNIISTLENDYECFEDIPEELVNNYADVHSKQYNWLYSTLFVGRPYSKENVKELIKANFGYSKNEIKNLQDSKSKQLSRASELIEQLKNIQWQEEARLLQEAIYYRTARLEWLNKSCNKIKPFFELISKNLDISYEELIYLLPEEIVNGLSKNSVVDRSVIADRQKSYALILSNEESLGLHIGNEVIELKNKYTKNQDNKDIKGTVASRGLVKGRVKILKDRTEIDKVLEGDIIVTKLTTPDFIVAMKKAAAIITDLGGMTSHAAIVARELNIPCIVGANNATQVLHDGDEVEVDADKGIVRILK